MKTKYGFETDFDESVEFYNVRDDRFDIYGLYEPRSEGQFRRLPADVAQATSYAVYQLSLCTAGGRVRFITDSSEIVIHAEMPMICRMDHCSLTGSSAFDIFLREGDRFVFRDSFRPPYNAEGGYEKCVGLGSGKVREILIHFPTYSEVSDLYIGVERGSFIKNGTPYLHEKPVVYYGSSITQGACACRPGNAYEAIISNEYNCDHVNLGFSGSALAEDAIVDYICSMDMSVFVMDYDHNAPNAEHLAATHGIFFRKFRASHPDTPVIMVTRPTFNNDRGVTDRECIDDHIRCREVVFKTYMDAVNSGDTLVEFIVGASLFNGPYADLCTVDAIHPNDAGFLRMASRIGQSVGMYL